MSEKPRPQPRRTAWPSPAANFYTRSSKILKAADDRGTLRWPLPLPYGAALPTYRTAVYRPFPWGGFDRPDCFMI